MSRYFDPPNPNPKKGGGSSSSNSGGQNSGATKNSQVQQPSSSAENCAQEDGSEAAWSKGFGRGYAPRPWDWNLKKPEESSARTRQEEKYCPLPQQARVGVTDAYLDGKKEEPGKCKLPRTYGQGIYEDKRDWVEEDTPIPATQVDQTDWSDGTQADNDNDNYTYIPKVLAGPNCSFFLAPGEKMIQCPYDKAHQILEARFQRHLVKCRANYTKQKKQLGQCIEIGICLYNVTHHIKQSLMAEHLLKCPTHLEFLEHEANMEAAIKENPGIIDTTPTFSQTKEQKSQEGMTYSPKSFAEDGDGPDAKKMRYSKDDLEDDWGLAPECKPYDPSKKLKEQAGFMNPQGLTRSERKEFRNNERIRVGEMEAKMKKEEDEMAEKNSRRVASDQFSYRRRDIGD